VLFLLEAIDFELVMFAWDYLDSIINQRTLWITSCSQGPLGGYSGGGESAVYDCLVLFVLTIGIN